MGVLVFGFLKVMLHVFEAWQPQPSAAAASARDEECACSGRCRHGKVKDGIKAAFPDPRLEEDEIHQLRVPREKNKLYTYGWVDQIRGDAHPD
jgi:hypothetical protein